MPEEKGSDLDVFEGLTKKKKAAAPPVSSVPSSSAAPVAPATMRGGHSSTQPISRPLPPPKSVGGTALPKPKPPPKKANSSPPSTDMFDEVPTSTALPKPTPPPKKRESDAPQLSVKPASVASVFDEPSGSVLPGHAVAELDWDDEEESTNVFDRSASDLFGDLAGKPRVYEDADAGDRRDVGKAAALLAMSGKAAKAIPSTPPPAMSAQPIAPAAVSAVPAPDPMPRIPAPAPVPRDISAGAMPVPAAEPRAQHPSWAPAAEAALPGVPPRRSGASGATILLSLFAVLAAAAGVFFYLRSSAAAQVQIKVSHNGSPVENAAIFIDGQRKCEFAPCKVKLEPGSWNVRVTSGQLAGRQSITVEGGKDVVLTIPLGVAPDTVPDTTESAKPEEPKGPPKLVMASGMGEDVKVKVFVNDEDKGPLPITLEDLKPGDVKLRFELDGTGDKYGTVEKTVALKPGEELKLNDIKLPLQKVKVKFELKTKGAKVKIISEGEKRTESGLTFSANKAEKTLNTKQKWTVEATLKGYNDFSKTIDFDGAGEELTFDIELTKEEEAPPPDPVATTGPTPGPTPTPTQEWGFVNANSRPPSMVIINGRPAGGTPVMGVKVKPGAVSITFKHPELGKRSTSVTVAAGETKTASVVFKKKAEPTDSGKKKKKKKKKGKKGKKGKKKKK